jgi:hypothetical protein
MAENDSAMRLDITSMGLTARAMAELSDAIAARLRALPRMIEPSDGSLWVDSEAIDRIADALAPRPRAAHTPPGPGRV